MTAIVRRGRIAARALRRGAPTELAMFCDAPKTPQKHSVPALSLTLNTPTPVVLFSSRLFASCSFLIELLLLLSIDVVFFLL